MSIIRDIHDTARCQSPLRRRKILRSHQVGPDRLDLLLRPAVIILGQSRSPGDEIRRHDRVASNTAGFLDPTSKILETQSSGHGGKVRPRKFRRGMLTEGMTADTVESLLADQRSTDRCTILINYRGGVSLGPAPGPRNNCEVVRQALDDRFAEPRHAGGEVGPCAIVSAQNLTHPGCRQMSADITQRRRESILIAEIPGGWGCAGEVRSDTRFRPLVTGEGVTCRAAQTPDAERQFVLRHGFVSPLGEAFQKSGQLSALPFREFKIG